MASDSLIGKLRSFFGLHPEPPRNDFRNPIWGSDDDDDDGDELYSRHTMDLPEIDIQRELTKHMHDMFKSFGSIFGDMRSFFHDEHFDAFTSMHDPEHSSEPDNFNSNSIRDYYLKPGYHNHKHEEKEDIDLDGKISSQEISGLLKKKDDGHSMMTIMPFDGTLVPGRSFCKTIITTSVTKPDGTVETRRIVKSGNEVIEETTTSNAPESRGPLTPGLDTISSTGIILAELGSLFRNFY